MTRYTSDKRGNPLQLQGKVSRIVHSLARSSFAVAKPESDESSDFALAVSEEAVASAIEAWRKRSSYFPCELVSDPAWGMLLELFQAEIQGRRVSFSSLCTVATISAGIGARWLNVLERRGLAVRRADPLQPNIEFVELSRKGSSALRRYFHEVVDRVKPLKDQG